MTRLVPILLLLATPALAGEVEEVARLAPKYGGRTEVRLPCGARVDLLTDTHAIEADWATSKVYEAIGQALYYSIETGKRPGIILLSRDPEREQRYIARCRKVCEVYQIDLWIEPVPDRRMSRRLRR